MTYRPNLKEIEASYTSVIKKWDDIDDLLDQHQVGRKDTPFNKPLMDNMLTGWDYIDYLLKKQKHDLLSQHGGPHMLEINNRVHYGEDYRLREEYKKAIKATAEKFTRQVPPIRKYYAKNIKREGSEYQVAAEVFISIVGQPQLFIEGNHRSGSLISSWINMVHGKPPFVLTVENALTFFEPAQVIKKFNKKSTWRSLTKLPKYKANFRGFWKTHCDKRFVKKN
jgi:hypothetical protein